MSMRTAVNHQAPPGSRSRPGPIPMDAWRQDDRFVIALDLPGIPLEGVEVEARGRMVTVRAERGPAPRGQDARIQIAERSHGVLERRIQLADTLDASRIEARLDSGVLTLTVPLVSISRRRKITVRGGLTSTPRQVEAADQAGQAVPAAA